MRRQTMNTYIHDHRGAVEACWKGTAAVCFTLTSCPKVHAVYRPKHTNIEHICSANCRAQLKMCPPVFIYLFKITLNGLDGVGLNMPVLRQGGAYKFSFCSPSMSACWYEKAFSATGKESIRVETVPFSSAIVQLVRVTGAVRQVPLTVQADGGLY